MAELQEILAVFNVAVADIPERKTDVVAGAYDVELPWDQPYRPVAVPPELAHTSSAHRRVGRRANPVGTRSEGDEAGQARG